MVGKKNNGTAPPALPSAKAPSSMQRSVTLDMPFLPSDGGGNAVPIGDSGHGEGSSYYARDGASSIHGETVRAVGARRGCRIASLGTSGEGERGAEGFRKGTGYFVNFWYVADNLSIFLTSSFLFDNQPKLLSSPSGRPPPSHHRAPVLRVSRGRQAHQPHRQCLEI